VNERALLERWQIALRERPGTLSERLSAAVLLDIETGALNEGEQLPHEPDLARELSVSRQTVNLAMTALARRGYLRRRRGIGTFVATPEIEQPLDGLYTFIRSVTAQQHRPGVRLFASGLTHQAEAQRALGITEVYHHSRIRTIDDEPFIIEHFFTTPEIGEAIPLDRLAAGEPIYDLIEQSSGLRITHASEVVRAVVLTNEECARLGISAGSPGFEVVRRGLAQGRLIEFRRSIIRGDRYHLRIELSGDSLDQRG
jgi:GntR family transcriptional regulator